MWQCHLSAQDYRYYPVDGYSLLKRFPLHPLTGPRCPVQTVGQWLESIGLPQYENHLMANGFDNVQFMVRRSLCPQSCLCLSLLLMCLTWLRRSPICTKTGQFYIRNGIGRGNALRAERTVYIETLAEKWDREASMCVCLIWMNRWEDYL